MVLDRSKRQYSKAEAVSLVIVVVVVVVLDVNIVRSHVTVAAPN